MGYEALALSFALITLTVTFSVLFLVLRSDLKKVQKGLTDLAGINVRTNMYAQSAIAQSSAKPKDKVPAE